MSIARFDSQNRVGRESELVEILGTNSSMLKRKSTRRTRVMKKTRRMKQLVLSQKLIQTT